MTDRPTDIRRALAQQLESWRRAGVRELPRMAVPPREIVIDLPHAGTPSPTIEPKAISPPRASDAPGVSTQQPRKEPPMASIKKSARTVDTSPAPAASAGDQAAELKILADEVAGCTLCRELAATRTQTVFGVGNPNARVVFFGEAPGADEDRQGEPFVGRAGQLLTKIIAACTWSRNDVYILNTLKCRPPGNRNPEAEENANCRPYWKRQLEIIQPEYIVCLGKFAMQELLETAPTQAIGRMRHKFHDYTGEGVTAKVVVTYHPSYLLRNPAAKKDVWDDMKMLLAEMGIELPSK